MLTTSKPENCKILKSLISGLIFGTKIRKGIVYIGSTNRTEKIKNNQCKNNDFDRNEGMRTILLLNYNDSLSLSAD